MMTNAQIERTLDRMVERLPPLMTEKGYARDTCILHTRVAVNMLRNAGLRAQALTVRVGVYNLAYAKWMSELGRMPRQTDDHHPGAWAVHIGFGRDPRREGPGFDGHVIAIVNERYALDLTIDQAARPEQGITTRPHWWIADRGFIAGGVHAFRMLNTFVRYEAIPEERGFLTVADWALPPLARAVLPSDAELEKVLA
jgi:hypothetical protein